MQEMALIPYSFSIDEYPHTQQPVILGQVQGVFIAHRPRPPRFDPQQDQRVVRRKA